MRFWEIVGGVIVSFGGVAGLVALILKFAGNMIAERLSKKYELKLNEALENQKSNLERKNYISKTRFDAEFQIYRELSKSFFDMTKEIGTMIPIGLVKVPSDKEAKEKYENDIYKNASNNVINAQDVLNQNAPFISKDFYEKYNEILQLCRQQICVFERRFDILNPMSRSEKETFSAKDYDRTHLIFQKLNDLNDSIREYLSKLDVIP